MNALPFTILGAYAKLRKATISFVMPLCPSVRPHGTTRFPLDGFLKMKFVILKIFENLSKKFRFH